MLRSHRFVRVAATAALLLFLTSASTADTNVRPQVTVGASMPVGWGTLNNGKMAGVAIEVERNARWSHIAEFQVHHLDRNGSGGGGVRPDLYPLPPPYIIGAYSEATLYTGQFGMRMHLAQASRVRPYLQAGLGVRVVSGSGADVWAMPADSYGSYTNASHVDGATAHVRFGLTTAGYHGAGLFLDGSAEAVLRNPRDFALAPIRFGITLP